MKNSKSASWGWKQTTLGLSFVALALGADAETPVWQSRVSKELLGTYQSATSSKSAGARTTTPPSSAFAPRLDATGRMQVDAHFDCGLTAPVTALKAAGLKVNASIKATPLCVVEGWVAPAALPAIASVPGITKVTVPSYSTSAPPKQRPLSGHQARRKFTQSGTSTIDGTAVTIMHADVFATQTTKSGGSVTIGALSDNVTSLALIQGRGELPAVNVVAPAGGTLSTTPGDEGTMMLEEIHAVAPGAKLAFCAPGTTVGYIGCLQSLVAAGVTIAVDDLAWGNEDLLSANSAFAQAVQSVLTASPNFLLFTVTENYNGSYWEANYSPSTLASLGYAPITCSASGQTDYYIQTFNGTPWQTLTVYAAGTYGLTLQWGDPYGANVSNWDVYYQDNATGTTGCTTALGSSNTYFGPSITLAVGTYDLYIATPDASLTSKALKLWIGGDGATALSVPTSGSIVSSQAFVPGVITTGAVIGSDGIGNTIEDYSGRGPIRLVFPTPQNIQAPTLVAPDAVYVDAAGTNFTTWADGNFHGTSAAGPNAAAVAALVRDAFPTLTPTQVTSALTAGAVQLGATVPDGTFGYGRVDAIGALNAISPPSISNIPASSVVGPLTSPAQNFAVGGTGNLHFQLVSSNAALIPATFVAAGTPGVTVTPASCGTGTTACTFSVTPVLGKSGSSSIQVIVVDGANRAASTIPTVTVTKPTPPTVSVTSNGSQSFTVGGSASAVGFTLTGTPPLAVTVTSSTSLVSASAVSGNCGTPANLTCSASITVVASQTGTTTLTFTATDPYGQANSAAATIQVNAAPAQSSGGGGGGVFNLLSLIGLLGVGGARLARRPRLTVAGLPL